MPRRARASAGAVARSLPSKLIFPLFTRSAPMMLRSRVVLPTPFRPIKQVQEPSGTSNCMFQRI
jgi:hypothetical protein